MDVAGRLASVRLSIEETLSAAGRTDAVTLVAVSKSFPAESLLDAYRAGQRDFGENRVQEAAAKREELKSFTPNIRWHLIGHLQTNKARAAVTSFQMIQSLDSKRIADAVNLRANQLDIKVPALFEVNVAGETSKSGFEPDDLCRQVSELLELSNIEPCGLMTIAPLVDDPIEVRPIFSRLRDLRDEIRERFALGSFSELSMGMSNDYQEAIRQGATIVRLGRAVFGERAGNP
ncbi:MAG TPA: YggS family pyridoxal phosphate-dependent enzyme [Chloroflexi bacterium]|nr:YggS family pyridoxal phosphate-dependent enzyme [Chloroflexota bacterium]